MRNQEEVFQNTETNNVDNLMKNICLLANKAQEINKSHNQQNEDRIGYIDNLIVFFNIYLDLC